VRVRIHKDWGDHNSLLGATIRYENYIDAHNHILAVQDVYLDSPAHEAGIQPFKDYIIGTREIAFKSLDEFAKYIEVNKGQEVKMYIYNVDQERIREVLLTPREWNG
jgi:C-terminal processing protease CtpA/Prc